MSEIQALKRDDRGRFVLGTVGNPGGRPKDIRKVSDLAKQHTESALATLVEICKNRQAPPSARVHAASAILDRAWGKPHMSVETKHTSSYADFLLRIAAEQQALPEHKRLCTQEQIDNTLEIINEAKQHEWE